MERREAIKNMGWTLGAFVATPSALSILQSCGPSMEPWMPALLTEEQGKMLRKLVDGFLPGVDEELPSGTAANVHVFIDRYLNEVTPLEEQEVFMSNLQLVQDELLKMAEEEEFEKVKPETVDGFLTAKLTMTEEQLEELQSQIYKLRDKDVEPENFPNDIRVFQVLNDIRGKCIWAYKNNEHVGKNVLAYDPIPGQYIGCGDLQELTGGRIWSG